MVELKNASAVVITVVVFAIVLGIGGTIMSDIQQTQCEGSGVSCGYNGTSYEGAAAWNSTQGACVCYNTTAGLVGNTQIPEDGLVGDHAVNASQGGLEGVGTMSDWIPTISVIIVSALVIGIIGAYFYTRR